MLEVIEKQMQALGIDVFGTSDCSEVVPARLEKTPFAITLGVRLADAVIDEVAQGPTKLYFHHYRTANAFLDHAAMRCAIALQRGGYQALSIPASQTSNSAGIAGDFAHKTAANLAGLGFMGKSALFITKDFGPRVRFATVLCDMPLKSGDMLTSQCGECSLCVAACPCGAIVGVEWSAALRRDDMVDAALCSHHMKEKFQMIGRGSVCGICMAVCPYGGQRNS